jgi:ABC-type transport system involved in multi-copper enzyme maturation permease subunit
MYVERVAVGAAMYLAAYLMFSDLLPSRSQSALGLLGRGREMFDRLVLLQFGAVYLFMPVLMAGTIAGEKERNTLVTLFVTRLSPATILVEKLLSRLIVMGTYLLLSMPLVALTYGLGGVGQAEMWVTYWMLLLTCVQVGLLGLWCSTFFHTTVGALAMTYIVGVVSIGCCFLNSPLALMTAIRDPGSVGDTVQAAVVYTGVSAIVAVAYFASALVVLWDRAFATPRNLLLEFFRGLDRFFKDLNTLTGGIELVRDDVALPEDSPVSWRETRKKSLGTVRYLFRILVAIEIPLLAVLTWTLDSSIETRREVDNVLFALLWPVSVLLVAVHAASLIAGERTKQTLDVLLASPLTGAEVVRQKFQSVGRLVLVLCVPFWTIGVIEWRTAETTPWSSWSHHAFVNVLCLAMSPVVLLPVAGWVAMWCGLRFYRQIRAATVAIALLAAWGLVPWLVFGQGDWLGLGAAGRWLTLAGPSGIVILERSGSLATLAGHGWPIVIGNFLGYATCLWWIRRQCLRHADRLLGRC